MVYNVSFVFKRLYIFFKLLNLFLIYKNLFFLRLVFFFKDLKEKKFYIFFFNLWFFYIFYLKSFYLKPSYSKFFYFNFGYSFFCKSYFNYKIYLLNVVLLPKILILNKKNNIFINVLNYDNTLLRSISLGMMREKRENKSLLRNRYFIMYKMGRLIGEYLSSFFFNNQIESRQKRISRYFNFLVKFIARRIFLSRALDCFYIIFFNFFYFYFYNFNFFSIPFCNFVWFSFDSFFLYFFILVRIVWVFFFSYISFFYFLFYIYYFFEFQMVVLKYHGGWVFFYFQNRFDLILNDLNKNILAVLKGILYFKAKIKFRRVKNVFLVQHAGCRLQKSRRRRFNSSKLSFLFKRIHLLSK